MGKFRRSGFALIALLIMFSLVVSACGSKNASAPAPSTSPAPAGQQEKPKEPVTITIWSHWGHDLGKKTWIETVMQKYMEQNPHVTMKVEWYGNKNDLYTQLRAIHQAGGAGAPDIHTLDVRPIGAIPQEQNGWLLNLKGGLDESRWDPEILGTFAYNDGIWGIPIEAFGSFLWYDENLFARWGIVVPESGQLTWEQFQEVAGKAKEAGLYPLATGLQGGTVYAAFFMNGIMTHHAGAEKAMGAINPNLKKYPYTDPDVQAGYELAKQLIDDGWYNPNANSLSALERYQPLFQGKAAMLADGSWMAGNALNPPEMGGPPKGFKMGVMRYPAIPGGKGNDLVEASAGSGWGASYNTKHPDVVIDFFNFLAAPEFGRLWTSGTSVPTGIANAVDENTPEIVRKQIRFWTENKKVSPAIYQLPRGDEEVHWLTNMPRFYSQESYSVAQFLQEMQDLREKAK